MHFPKKRLLRANNNVIISFIAHFRPDGADVDAAAPGGGAAVEIYCKEAPGGDTRKRPPITISLRVFDLMGRMWMQQRREMTPL